MCNSIAWNTVTGALHVELPKGRKLRQRCYAVDEVKCILAYAEGEDRAFFWLAAETGLRADELMALRVSDVDIDGLSLEVRRQFGVGPNTFRKPKLDSGPSAYQRLGDYLKKYLDGRTEGFHFQTATGKPWEAGNVLNTLLERLGIPKIDIKLPAKVVGKDRTLSTQSASQKRAASVGLHSFRHANATAMDSLGIQQRIRKQRLGHSGNSVTETYTHTFKAV